MKFNRDEPTPCLSQHTTSVFSVYFSLSLQFVCAIVFEKFEMPGARKSIFIWKGNNSHLTNVNKSPQDLSLIVQSEVNTGDGH